MYITKYISDFFFIINYILGFSRHLKYIQLKVLCIIQRKKNKRYYFYYFTLA